MGRPELVAESDPIGEVSRVEDIKEVAGVELASTADARDDRRDVTS